MWRERGGDRERERERERDQVSAGVRQCASIYPLLYLIYLSCHFTGVFVCVCVCLMLGVAEGILCVSCWVWRRGYCVSHVWVWRRGYCVSPCVCGCVGVAEWVFVDEVLGG